MTNAGDTAGPNASDAADERLLIDVLSGNPSPEELAAVTAVLSASLDELAEESGRREATGPSAWQRSQRSLRKPIEAGLGRWRGFSG